MTTSYELSLKLKELGVEQEGGEYYWVELHGKPHVLYYIEGYTMNKKQIICRAFTLGELVRMIGDDFNLHVWIANDRWFVALTSGEYTSPEEAAGELLCEILKQKYS